MSKENIVVLHPREWTRAPYAAKARFAYHHVSIGGKVPRKRDGTPTNDGYAELVTDEGKQHFKDVVSATRPRVILFWMHGGLPNSLLEWAKNTVPGLKLVHWYSNHRLQIPKGVVKVAHLIDALLMNDDEPQQFAMYKAHGLNRVYRFWDGFETWEPDSVAAMNADVPQEFDCFFGGHSYLRQSVRDNRFKFPMGKYRYDFICAVAKRFKLALHADNKYKWPGLPVLPPVYHPHYTVAMRRAKVTLNVNHFQFRHAYTRRTIRSIFAGRPHVTHYIPGIEDDFENGKHLFWFNEIEEGLEQIDRLLKDKPLRVRVARECLALAHERHSFKQRLIEFEDILEDLGV